MILQKLTIYNVRNIGQISLTPSPAMNFFYGKNGSGKSSLLEAVYILGRAKSFRSASINKVIQIGKQELIVSGGSIDSNDIHNQLGIRLDGRQVEIRINGASNVSRSELVSALPIQLIHPKSYLLLDGGSRLRREFIDWGVFNLHKDFLPTWRKFKKSLSQRNVLLKTKQVSQLEVWNHELFQYGTIVAEYRQKYMQLLQPVFSEIIAEFLQFDSIELKTFAGWDTEKDFQQLLVQDLEKDLRYGYTHSGPHRGEFQLLINARNAKDYVSRGQLKLLVLALKMAQVKLLDMQCGIPSCILMDDTPSELDLINRKKLIHYLSVINGQVFITATEKKDFGDLSQIDNFQMFHVEHGNITRT